MKDYSTWFIDTTLRDGEQAPGVSFTRNEKLTIASMLDTCGVHELEAGIPAMGKSEIETIRLISQSGFRFRITSWCRALIKDLEAAKESKSDAVHISFPVSDIHLKAMGRNRLWVLNSLSECLCHATNNFSYVSVGAQDASRADKDFLNYFIANALSQGAERIRIADTVGILNPFSTATIITDILKKYPTANLEFHAHNDLGMATANTLSAIQAGATSVSTTINGLGERAGNASLDEVVMALKLSFGVKSSIHTNMFMQMAEFVERASGRKTSESKPITGKLSLKHESGIHTRCQMKDKNSYQIIDEGSIGSAEKNTVVFGKHSGSAGVQNYFNTKGLEISQAKAEGILNQIKLMASIKKGIVSDSEMMNMYYQLS